MKQVININFQGRVVPIEQNAYEILKDYIQSLNNYFAAEVGKEEIVNDIENRIGELFQQKIDAGNNCITELDVEAVINSIGRVEDFDDEAGSERPQSGAKNTYGAEGVGYKKLLRDENNKIIGGVCSGVAHYIGIDITVARIIFAILFFSFGIGFLAYIILWVVVPSSATLQMGSKRKRLFRDKDNSYVAGVCSGIAQYFHISVWIPRLIFLLPLIGFFVKMLRWSSWDNMGEWGHWNNFNISYSPGLLISYIIAWLVIPEAKTTSEKLEMKGEKVDMNSIKKSVTEEIKGVQKRASKFANEASSFATTKSAQMANDVNRAAGKSKTGLGEFISLVVKIITYFILGSLLIAFLAGLIVLAVFSIGIFPLKDFVISGTYQNLYAWGTLILFIAVPVIGIIVYVIRRITKVKTGTKYIAPTFSALWALGWVSMILLIVSVKKDFQKANIPQAEDMVLTNPGVQKLILSSSYNENEFRLPQTLNFEPFDWIDEDTAIARNITINIFKSPIDSFKVVMYKSARGKNRDIAALNASMINFNIVQRDSMLLMNEGIAINKTNKFRNQEVIVNVYVPVGKSIRIHENTRRNSNVKIDFAGLNMDDRFYDQGFYGWRTNENYTMMADGLHSEDGEIFLEGKWGGRRNEEERVNDNGIKVRGENGETVTINENGIKVTDADGKDKVNIGGASETDAVEKTKIEEQKLKQEKRRIEDSLRRSMEETQRKLDKLRDNAVIQHGPNQFVIASYNPMMMLSLDL